MLDCRYYRTNPFAKERTMLGPVQKKWLLNELTEIRRRFQSHCLQRGLGARRETGQPRHVGRLSRGARRNLLIDRRERIDGVVLLSADRHRSDARLIPRPGGYALYDFMSSRLTNFHTHELVPGAIFDYNEKCSFGLLTFDTVRSRSAGYLRNRQHRRRDGSLANAQAKRAIEVRRP